MMGRLFGGLALLAAGVLAQPAPPNNIVATAGAYPPTPFCVAAGQKLRQPPWPRPIQLHCFGLNYRRALRRGSPAAAKQEACCGARYETQNNETRQV